MSAKKGRTQRRRVQSSGRRLKTAMSREARTAYAEVQTGVHKLEKSIADIRRRAARAERQVEVDARRQIRELHGRPRTIPRDDRHDDVTKELVSWRRR